MAEPDLMVEIDELLDSINDAGASQDSSKIVKVPQKLIGKQLKEDKPEYCATFPDLVDLVLDKYGQVLYLWSDNTTSDEKIENGITYIPPRREKIPPNLLLPRLEEVRKYAARHEQTGETGETGEKCECGDCSKLFDDLIKYHQQISQLPDDDLYLILASWDFHTYCLERAQYSPIIYFFSVAERGKSRTIKGMSYVAYRGIRKGDIKDAQLIRDCTRLGASIAFDMTDFWEKVKASGSQDVILNRYERGVTVSRVTKPEKGPFEDTEYFDVFGPTLLATNEIINDIADTRSIAIVMKRANRQFTGDVTQELGLPFKERLVAFRLAHMNDTWKDVERIAEHRLGDITKPLYQIVVNVAPHHIERLKGVVKQLEKSKLSEKMNSVQAEIVQAIATSYLIVRNNTLPNQVIVTKINSDKPEREHMAPKKVSNMVKALGFYPTTTATGTVGFIWDDELIDRLAKEFGVTNYSPAGSAFSQDSPVSPVSPNGHAEASAEALPLIDDLEGLEL